MLYWVNQFAVAPDEPGGTRHFEMGRELVRLGTETTIVASDLNLSRRTYSRRDAVNDHRYLHEEQDGVRFVWLPAGSYRRNDWRRVFSMFVFAAHALWFLLRTPMSPGSAIIGSTPSLPAAAAARLAAFLRRIPFLLEVRDLWPESLAVAGEERGLVYSVLRILADFLYRTSPTVVVLAAGNAERVAARGVPSERIHYIPNGVDPSAFEHAQPTGVPGVPSNLRAFVYAGAHGPANGLNTVIAAAALLRDRGEERARLVFVGDGPSKADLMEDVRRRGLDNVTFLDPLPKAAIPGLLRSCTAGLMPLADVALFSYGVSPNKLFDYLSAGLPVITNVPGDVARMVREAGAGIVVPPADPDAIAEAIVEVLDRAKEFASGLPWIQQHHDRALLARRLSQLLPTGQTSSS